MRCVVVACLAVFPCLIAGCKENSITVTTSNVSSVVDENTQINAARTKAKQLRLAVIAYHLDNGDYPQSLEDLTKATKVSKPYAAPADIVDPWGKTYELERGSDDIRVSTFHNGSIISDR